MHKLMEVIVQMNGGHGKSTIAAIVHEALKDCKIPVKLEDGPREAGDAASLLENREKLIRNTLSISEREKLMGGYVLVKTKSLNPIHMAEQKTEEKTPEPVTVDWTEHKFNKPMPEYLGMASSGFKFQISVGHMWREELINYKPKTAERDFSCYSGNIYAHLHYWHKNEWVHLENVQLARHGLPLDCELQLTDSLDAKTTALLTNYDNAVAKFKNFAEVLAGKTA